MPPKASGRSSARSAISKNSASSPLKPSRERDSASPVERRTRTRSTRSPSVESRTKNGGRTKVKKTKGTVSREGSVDSVASNNSTASRRGARTRQGAQMATRALTPLPEDREEEGEGDFDEHSPHLQSPGAVSQLSGTTAITSHSQSQIAQIRTVAVEILPDLFSRSQNILDLLAPSDVDVTEETIRKTIRELRTLSSNTAIRLKLRERDFDTLRENFGSDGYIRKSLVFKGLMGSDEPGPGDFRPDAILYAANLATLVKTFLVAEQKSQKTCSSLMALDSHFCQQFTDAFDENTQSGGSNLFPETFKLGLEIRTQCVIANLERLKDHEDFDPSLILVSAFYQQPAQRDASLDAFQDYTLNGTAKEILRGVPNSEDGRGQIYLRLTDIKECFRQNAEAIEVGDVVDNDQLEERFPWVEFLECLVRWSRSRFDEVNSRIVQQGGAENIANLLQEMVDLISGEERSDSQSDSIGSRTAPNQPKANETRDDDMDDNGDDEDPQVSTERPNAEYASSWQQNMNEKNKENLTSNPNKGNIFDAQPGAQSVEWDDSQPSQEEVMPSRKRQQAEVDDEDDEDEGFEQDQRPGPSRKRKKRGDDPRQGRPSSGRQSKTRIPTVNNAARQSSLRREQQARMEDESDDDEPGPSRIPASNTSRSAGRRTAATNNDPIPRYTASQVSVMAREETIRSKAKQAALNKRRIPWSEADSELLVDRIQEFGCAWATIHKLGDWEHERDQVALKDRARNMKVTFLKSGLDVLPMNFELIRLGQKEINSVRAVIPDYEPEP